MKKKILLIVATLLLTSTIVVYGQSENSQGNAGDTQSEGQQGEGTQRCTDVTRRVGTITEKYDQSQDKYMHSFQNIHTNVERIALKFKEDGYDTTQLETDLAEYKNMLQNAQRYYYEFRTGMDNTKKGVCGNSETEADRQFTSARTQLMACKKEMTDLKDFAQSTLKDDLLELKAQIEE